MNRLRMILPILAASLAGLGSCTLWLSAAAAPSQHLQAASQPQPAAVPSIEPSLLLNGTAQSTFASPAGSGSACTQSQPCNLGTAAAQSTPGGILYLAGGTYTAGGPAVLVISRSLAVLGGWDGAAGSVPRLDPQTYLTVLDGEMARRGVLVAPGITVSLSGFYVQQGFDARIGGGLYAQDANLSLSEVHFSSNTVSNTQDVDALGGGAAVEGGRLKVIHSSFQDNAANSLSQPAGGGLLISMTLSARISDTVFADNDAWNGAGLAFYGLSNNLPFTQTSCLFQGNGQGSTEIAIGGYAGAALIQKADAILLHNRFRDNWASNDYGALGVFQSRLVLDGNIFSGNRNARTAALLVSSTQPFRLENNLFVFNQATLTSQPQPTLRVSYSRGVMQHNTFALNTASYAVHILYNSSMDLTDNLIVSHTLGISVAAGASVNLIGNLWGAGVWANGVDYGGSGLIVDVAGNLHGDPGFIDPAGGDFRLRPDSDARDHGLPTDTYFDLLGRPRPYANFWDMGAYEYSGEGLFLPLVIR